MPPSRRTRRKLERRRASRPQRDSRISVGSRLLLIAGGIVAVVVGIALLVHEAAPNAARLGRLAGILIVVGLVIAGIGAIGRL